MQEHEESKEIRRYDLLNVQFETLNEIDFNLPLKFNKYTKIPIFNRLEFVNLSIGDSVYAWVNNSSSGSSFSPFSFNEEYEGLILVVDQYSIIVSFCEKFYSLFSSSPSLKFCLRFSKQRMFERMKHRAIDKVDLKLIFPKM